jgi:sugar phosphate isomerase/epimerase
MTHVQINVPYSILLRRLDFVVAHRINPEIYFSGEDLDVLSTEDVKRVSETLEQSGLTRTIHGPFMDLSPGGVDRRIKEVTIERLSRTIDLAGIVRPRAIVFHAGYEKWKFDGDVGLWLRSSLETWRPLIERARELGLTLAIENVFEETPESLKMLLEEIDSPCFRFCFDMGHQHVFSRTPVGPWMEALGSYLAEVHLHDNRGEMDDHLPVGEGTADFDLFFKLLTASGMTPIYTLEPHEEPRLWRSLEAIKRYL